MFKLIERIREDGIPVRKLNIIMLIVEFALSSALFAAMSMTNANYRENHEMTKMLLGWRKDSYNLQIGSDYLTEEIRCFAATGDKTHLDNYFEEANVTQRRENALSTLKEKHGDSDALSALSDAMGESKYLMNREYYAARLAVEGYGLDLNDFPEEIRNVELSEQDKALPQEEQIYSAISYLFDEEYTISKIRINNDIYNCLNTLEGEIDQKQNEVALQFKEQVLFEHIMTIILIFATLVIVIINQVLVLKPLYGCVKHIRKDFVIPLTGAHEIRFLAKNYNLMYYTAKEKENQLSYDANHDKLTGLFNRRGYEFFLKNIDMETSALMIIDLDKFKGINDTYGHDIGDQVIKKASKVILNSFRSQDYVCRIGGDEFAVIMLRADASMKEMIKRKADMINEKMSAAEGEEVPSVSCSAGVAFGQENITVNEVFKRADEALYNAKENGRNGIAFYG